MSICVRMCGLRPGLLGRSGRVWAIGTGLALGVPAMLAPAQTIDFEALPDGSSTADQQFISDEYEADRGVRFDLVDPVDLTPIGSPQIAKVGNPQTAFDGCGPDTPLDDQGVGVSFLTDDNAISGFAGTLLLTYITPVAQAAGVILDIDTRTGAQYEEWTIEALDATMAVLDTVVLTAPEGPDNCGAGQGPGDGRAEGFLFDHPSADIYFIVLRYTGTATSIGLAFDNFTPDTIPGPPSVTIATTETDACFGETQDITATGAGGLLGYHYQWQWAAPGEDFIDIVGATDRTIAAPALPGYLYRVILTDAIGRSATSDAIGTDARPIVVTLKVETAAGSGVYDTIATGMTPFVIGEFIESYYGYTGSEQYYHGDVPTLTAQRSHLFMTVGTAGQSLANVHDWVGQNGGGRAEMQMDFEHVTPSFLAKDDPADTYGGDGTDTLTTRQNWNSPNTDGWAVGPMNGSWNADVRFADVYSGTPTINGLADWAFYSADGAIYPLPLEENRRVRLEALCVCRADLNMDGVYDFFDVQIYLGLFAAGDPAADVNNDGLLDFFDVLQFIGLFAQGCA